MVVEHRRAVGGPDSFGVEQVLDPEGEAAESANSLAPRIESSGRSSFLHGSFEAKRRERPELRIEHFGALDLPCLFVSGSKDPFGSPEELEAHAAAIPGPVSFVWLPGGHDPRNADDAIAAAVGEWLTTLS